MPSRVQITRHRPWRTDHPDAVIVDRRTRWGNPYRITRTDGAWLVRGPDLATAIADRSTAARTAVDAYRLHLGTHPALAAAARTELAGRDLACWCAPPAPGQPDHCHGAVLLRVAAGGQP